MENTKWYKWAEEIQSISQAGLYYSQGIFDKERYKRLREISAEIISEMTDTPFKQIYDVFCNEKGYQTPKLETRAAIIKDNKILLVQELDGRWSLPGGWVDVDLSIEENLIKETKEEAGLDVEVIKIVAILDKKKNNPGTYPYGVTRVFALCNEKSGTFQKNIETLNASYFSIENIPELYTTKTNYSQIQMCFNAYFNDCWKVIFD